MTYNNTVSILEQKINSYLFEYYSDKENITQPNKGGYVLSNSLSGGYGAFLNNNNNNIYNLKFEINQHKGPKYINDKILFFYNFAGQMDTKLKNFLALKFSNEFSVELEITTYYEIATGITTAVLKVNMSFFETKKSLKTIKNQESLPYNYETNLNKIKKNDNFISEKYLKDNYQMKWIVIKWMIIASIFFLIISNKALFLNYISFYFFLKL